MGDWVLNPLLIVCCIVQCQSYMVTDASIEKVVTAPIRFGSVASYSEIQPKQSKKAFRPSKQLFSNILLPSSKPEQPQKHDQVYARTNTIAKVSGTPKDQIENLEDILYGIPIELINNDQEKKQQSIELYSKDEREISNKPVANKKHSVTGTVGVYNNPIQNSPEKPLINSGSNNQKRKEIHYHQHKHLHDHEHKQDHLHKHRQEHMHDHGHTHQDNNKHDHYHLGQHGHHHIDEHYHTHEGSHHHEHQSSHQHDHQQEHKHGHQHQQKHDHHDKHSHEHNRKGEHSHNHRGSHGHEHKQGHEHHSKHRHSHKKKDERHEHHEHYEHEHEHEGSKHNSKHKLVQQKIIIKEYHH